MCHIPRQSQGTQIGNAPAHILVMLIHTPAWYNDDMITTAPNGNTAPKLDVQAEYRKLPGVDALLREPGIALLVSQYGQRQVTASLRELLAHTRQAIANGQTAPERSHWTATLATALAENNLPSLRPVINAT